KAEHKRGIERMQYHAGCVVSSRVRSPELIVEDMREAWQRLIVRLRARKRPANRAPGQSLKAYRLSQVLIIVHPGEKPAAHAWPMQPECGRKNRQRHF